MVARNLRRQYDNEFYGISYCTLVVFYDRSGNTATSMGNDHDKSTTDRIDTMDYCEFYCVITHDYPVSR